MAEFLACLGGSDFITMITKADVLAFCVIINFWAASARGVRAHFNYVAGGYHSLACLLQRRCP